MYGTRSQSHAFDENKRVEAKGIAAAAKAPGLGKARAMQANNRRVLGDIGNLVGSLSARCNVNDENGACKPPVVPIDRPITRRFAQAHKLNVGGKPPIPLVPASRHHVEISNTTTKDVTWGAKQRRTTVSMKQNPDVAAESARPHPVELKPVVPRPRGRPIVKKPPTLTAQLTAWSEAACGGFDAEMIDAEEPLRNIDEGDAGNQLAVVDYVEDIYSFYRKAELEHAIPSDFLRRQTEINERMRAILVDWLVEVHFKFKLMPETLFLTVRLIDAFLSRQNVGRKYLQLVGVTSMLIASKYEEIWAPEVSDFKHISDDTYTREEILCMEKRMLNTLNFNLTVPTPYVFTIRFLKAASANREMEMLAFFLVELCLTEYVIVKFPPSLLAASAVYTAQCCLKKSPVWSPLLQRHTGYSESQLRECATLMVSFHEKSGGGPLKVVHLKYSSSKLAAVASIAPAKLPPL